MDHRPPGSSVHRILQARTLEWVALPSSRRSSRPRDGTSISYVSCIDWGFFTSSTTWESFVWTSYKWKWQCSGGGRESFLSTLSESRGGAHSCCLFSSGPESRGLFHCLFGPAETRWCPDAAAAVQPQCLWCRPDSGRGLSTQLVEFRSTLTVPASTPLDEPWEVFIDSWAVANGLTVQSPLGKLQAHKQDTPLGGHTRW